MRKYKGKLLPILLIALSMSSLGSTAYAHPGKTDSSGGHKDNKNISGLGSYHYHCGGNPAHLHKNGVCPYSSDHNIEKSSNKTEGTKKVKAEKIQINENIEAMEVGNTYKLTAIITPENVTDGTIKWKSSSESIATVNSSGEVSTKKSGAVSITATTINGKEDTIKVNIMEKKNNDSTANNVDAGSAIGGIATCGAVCAVGCLGYKRYKKGRKGKQ